MNTMQANGKFYIFEHPQNLIEVTEGIYNEIKSMQQQYKSIVKKVDPKNLPDFGVLILDQKSELYSTGLFIENQRVVGFLNSKHEITRYIEIEDIIKLLEDSK